jgi:hypothetical protein
MASRDKRMEEIVIRCEEVSNDIIAPSRYVYGRVRIYYILTIDKWGRHHRYLIPYNLRELDPYILKVMLSGMCE